MTHHPCEPVWHYRKQPCPYCQAGSNPMPSLATKTATTRLGALWLAARLNSRQDNNAYRWHRYGKTVQLD